MKKEKKNSICCLLFLILTIHSLLCTATTSSDDNDLVKLNKRAPSSSIFDLYESENFKYNFEISNEPINKDDLLDDSQHFVSLTSIHGQLYSCNLTHVMSALNEVETSRHLDVDVETNKPIYNFTYIKTELDRVLGDLNKTNSCITRVRLRKVKK